MGDLVKVFDVAIKMAIQREKLLSEKKQESIRRAMYEVGAGRRNRVDLFGFG